SGRARDAGAGDTGGGSAGRQLCVTPAAAAFAAFEAGRAATSKSITSGKWSEAARVSGENGAKTSATRISGLTNRWSMRSTGSGEGKVAVGVFFGASVRAAESWLRN